MPNVRMATPIFSAGVMASSCCAWRFWPCAVSNLSKSSQLALAHERENVYVYVGAGVAGPGKTVVRERDAIWRLALCWGFCCPGIYIVLRVLRGWSYARERNSEPYVCYSGTRLLAI